MDRLYWTDSKSFSISEDLELLFHDAVRRGYRPFRELPDFSNAYGVANDKNTKSTFFIHRGRGQPGRPHPLLEVLLYQGDRGIRLGTYFGLREHTCIVVAGHCSAQTVWNCWLEGSDILIVLNSAIFFNRIDMSQLSIKV